MGVTFLAVLNLVDVMISKMRILAGAQLRLTFLRKETAQLREELAFPSSLLVYPRLHWAKPSDLLSLLRTVSLAGSVIPTEACPLFSALYQALLVPCIQVFLKTHLLS